MNLGLDKSIWQQVTFGDVVLNTNETVKDAGAAPIERIIAMEHMDPGDLKIQRWGDAADGTTFTRRVRPGQTLFGKRRAYQRKVAYAEFDAICSGDIYTFEADETRMLGDFLPFLVQSNSFFDHALDTSAGSLSPRTNWRDLANFKFRLPPLDEQTRIADLLWANELAQRETNDLLAAATAVREAIIEARFVGDGIGVLQDLCGSDGIRIGPFGAQLHAYDYVDDGECPVVMPQDMINGRISTANIQRVTRERAAELAPHRLHAGDVLLPRRGELDRRALVTDAEAGWLCGTGSVRIRVRDGVSQQAVYFALSSRTTVEWLKSNATGTTMPNLNAGIVARIPIALPSSESIDDALREVEALDAARAALADQAAKADRLKAALLGEFFGGV